MSAAVNDRSVVVWDPLLRVLHWTLAGSVAVAFLSAEEVMTLHIWAGLSALGVVATRIVWGLLGPRTARFGDFIPTPAEVVRHLRDLLRRRAERHGGHNPAAGAMAVALLLTVLATVLTGLLTWAGALGGEAGEEVHEALSNLLLVLIGLHVAGALLGSLAERQNLVRSMITGRKRVDD